MKVFNRADSKEKRLALRRNQTPEEYTLWQRLRRKRLCGVKFFRQYGIGYYIADFYSPSVKLAIELDGCHHWLDSDVKMNDFVRTEQLESLGITVLRFENEDIRCRIGEVEKRIVEKLRELSPNPSLCQREGNRSRE